LRVRVMGKLAYVIIGSVLALATMVLLPLRIVELVSAGKLDALFGGIVILLLLVGGSVVAFFTIILPTLETMDESDAELLEVKERLRMYRARQRAMLEELDEIKQVLEELRDVLKKGMGE